MKYKLRIVYLAGGECRIEKRHWLKTLGFWTAVTICFGTEYWQGSERSAKRFIEEYYSAFDNNKVVRYEEQ